MSARERQAPSTYTCSGQDESGELFRLFLAFEILADSAGSVFRKS